MKIIRLSLENFQGLPKTEFLFNGRNANIYGDNAVGKTTVFNAFTWLLFGNSSTGAKDYNPKTKTDDGDAHKLEHSVECEMEIDGETITFKRLFKEVWKKTRGQAESNLSGHTTDFYINGVPKKEKEYNRYWEDIFKGSDGELPKLLTMPFYFPETLHWDKRRQILLDICGVISDREIMQTDEELKILAGLLGSNTVDEFKKITKSSLTKINSEIQSIPARIDEAQKAMPNWSDYSHSPVGIDDALAAVRAKIENAVAQRHLYLCEKFIRIKSELLNDKINERFQTVSFQLFKKNITNDGIEDSCDVLIPSEDGSRVPFPLANNAARINAGLEIIGVLGEHYGVELPVFIDNAESVTRLIEMNSQIIRLIVSETDKKLRLELL